MPGIAKPLLASVRLRFADPACASYVTRSFGRDTHRMRPRPRSGDSVGAERRAGSGIRASCDDRAAMVAEVTLALSVPAFLVSSALFGMAGIAGDVANVLTAVAFLGFALLPVAIGVAVLRYRLFEIDRIISRTISYATVTGVLVVAFAGAILLFQSVLAPVTGGNTVAVAASTLVVAALFQPLRRWVQSRVDRRFDRTRYDAERILAEFASGLRDEVDLGQLGAEIQATVALTVAPASVWLWLRQ
jgi:hypothetical protein